MMIQIKRQIRSIRLLKKAMKKIPVKRQIQSIMPMPEMIRIMTARAPKLEKREKRKRLLMTTAAQGLQTILMIVRFMTATEM